jgi:hypothetical protein
MKKTIATLAIAAMALSVTPAFAHEDGIKAEGGMKAHLEAAMSKGNGNHFGISKILNRIADKDKDNDADDSVQNNKFVIVGSVAASASGSLTLNVQHSINISVTNNQVSVVTNGDTKVTSNQKDTTVTLANLKVGDKVVVSGTVSGSTFTATSIRVMYKTVAFGTVTAKTDTSITLTNAKTGVTQTFTTNGDTQVKVDGEAVASTDVQVGDKGFVKFKTDASILIAKFINLFR